MLTIPSADWDAPRELPHTLIYLKGQLEIGEHGYIHWQLVAVSKKKCKATGMKRNFCSTAHVEVTRSAAANEYVWKDDTCFDPNSRFELGRLPLNRNEKKDWDQIWNSAKRGALDEIPADVRVRSYKTLKSIEKDYMRPTEMLRTVRVYYGPTGMGKSRRAWYEAGITAYPKGPTSIYWDGYQNHENVVIDEFRGQINISHLLRWFDRYPVCVECKFGACILNARNIWITSNIPPEQWFPDLDPTTFLALQRRLNTELMDTPWSPPMDISEISEEVELDRNFIVLD